MARDFSGTSSPHTDRRCPDCWQNSQARRHLHWLQFPDEFALMGHFRAQYASEEEWRAEDQRGTFAARQAWIRAARQLYGDLLDETGRPLPVWRAWRAAHGGRVTGQEGKR
jgi:hypothetical protein